MKRVLILGAGGMAGHVLSLYMREVGFYVTTLSAHRRLDADTVLLNVTKADLLEEFLGNESFDVVVNCIGVLAKESESRKDLAAYLNGFLPHMLEHYYSSSLTKVIHLGTDSVFGSVGGPYKESAQHSPEDFYARSKSLGEIDNAKDLTFRMSIIGPELGPEGSSLFNWFYRQSGVILGFDQVLWSGITTVELARAIVAAIEQDLTGIYHLTSQEGITKYDLLKLLARKLERNGLEIRPDGKLRVDRRLTNTRNDFSFEVRSYEEMVEDMLRWMSEHMSLYHHYDLRQNTLVHGR